MEKAFPFGFDQEGYAGVCRSECLDPQVMIFIEISFFRDVVSISNFEVTIPLLFEKNMNEV